MIGKLEFVSGRINWDNVGGCFLLALLLAIVVVRDLSWFVLALVATLLCILAAGIPASVTEKMWFNVASYALIGLITIIFSIVVLAWGYVLASLVLFLLGSLVFAEIILRKSLL